MIVFPDKEGTGEYGGNFKVGYAQQARLRVRPTWQRDRTLEAGAEESGPIYIEDIALINERHGIFGVADGVTSSDGGHPSKVARIALRTIEQSLIGSQKLETEADYKAAMKRALNEARLEIDQDGNAGLTTATVVWPHERPDGRYDLPLLHVGNCSLYVHNKYTNEHRRLTNRQSDPDFKYRASRLVNWIGSSVHSRYITGYDQIRTDTVVYSGSRLIICSDGITGDIEKDRVSDEELSFCFSLKSPQEVADALVVVSRADDDKTALVIDLE